ncbi:hypothetical protein OEZ86_008895 [Tetradesmus obliquus]|nr:hypothetical protein OEZ86_008895 [Tetradesmus obliquus]
MLRHALSCLPVAICTLLNSLLIIHLKLTDAQGLLGPPAFLRASETRAHLFAQLNAATARDARKLGLLYQPRRASSCRAIPRAGAAGQAAVPAGTLCGVDVASVQGKAALTVATSPAAYDSRSLQATGGLNLVRPARNQGQWCGACVAFAVTSAAETAMAARLGVNATDLPALSERDLMYCSTKSAGCGGWLFQDALENLRGRSLQPLQPLDCMPFPVQEEVQGDLCSSKCEGDNPVQRGTFEWTRAQPLETLWQVQRHIRVWGSVVTSFNVYPDFRPFMKAHPKGVYEHTPSRNDSSEDVIAHAVAVVGYNAKQDYLICKNSWGSQFGDQGFFKVRTCHAGTLDPAQTFGVMWTPFDPSLSSKPAVAADKDHPDCYVYTGVAGDYLDKVARRLGVGAEAVAALNADGIPGGRLDADLAGVRLLVCGIDTANVVLTAQGNQPATSSGSAAGMHAEQQAALLAFKSLLKTSDGSSSDLNGWAPSQPFCTWPGIKCDEEGYVTNILLRDNKLVGAFSKLAEQVIRLPRLHELDLTRNHLWGGLGPALSRSQSILALGLGGNNLTGTLPKEFGALRQIGDLWLWGNHLTGTLPPEWRSMKSLGRAGLDDNLLIGTLPLEYGSLAKLRHFTIARNKLRGTLPASWSGMRSMMIFIASGNRLEGQLPDSLSSWTWLQQLLLQDNKFSGTLPPSWSALVSLEQLSLFGNSQLRGPVPASWGLMSSLQWVEIFGTQLQGCLPSEWKAMRVSLPRPAYKASSIPGLAGTSISGYCGSAALPANSRDIVAPTNRPAGDALLDGSIVRCPDTGAVYRISGSHKFRFASPGAMAAHGAAGSKDVANCSALARIPDGKPPIIGCPSAPQGYYYVQGKDAGGEKLSTFVRGAASWAAAAILCDLSTGCEAALVDTAQDEISLRRKLLPREKWGAVPGGADCAGMLVKQAPGSASTKQAAARVMQLMTQVKYQCWQGWNVEGTDLRRLTDIFQQEVCEVMCSLMRPQCTFFVLNSDGTCYLKRSFDNGPDGATAEDSANPGSQVTCAQQAEVATAGPCPAGSGGPGCRPCAAGRWSLGGAPAVPRPSCQRCPPAGVNGKQLQAAKAQCA